MTPDHKAAVQSDSAVPAPPAVTPDGAGDELARELMDARQAVGASTFTFAVMPFSRGRNGKLTPGDAVEAANGEIAWRMAQALATEHGNVGAAAFSRTGPPRPVSIAECAMLACFGEVDLQAVAG